MFPANGLEFSIFLLIKVQEGLSWSTIDGYVNSARFFHKIFKVSFVLEDSVFDYVKKFAVKPNLKKRPLLHSEYLRMISYLDTLEQNVHVLRNSMIFSFAWNGFMRYDDISQLRIADVSVDLNTVHLKIRQAKNDYSYSGQQLNFKLPGDRMLLFKKYLELSSLIDPQYVEREDVFLFPKIVDDVIFFNEKIMYHHMREIILNVCVRCDIDIRKISTHSFRIGACTQASSLGVGEYLLDAHGRWAPQSRARSGYQRKLDSDNDLLLNILN